MLAVLLLLGACCASVAADVATSPTGAAAHPANCRSIPTPPAGTLGAVSIINAGGPALCGYWTGDTADAAAAVGGKPENWVGRNAKCQEQTPQCTVRYGINFSYAIPAAPGRAYRLRLTFTEVWWQAAGKRVFDVLVDGTTRLAGVDPYALGGGEFEPVVRELEVTAGGDSINLQFKAISDNALVAAVEVFPVAPAAAAAEDPAASTATQRKLQGAAAEQRAAVDGAAAEGKRAAAARDDEDAEGSDPPSVSEFDASLLAEEEAEVAAAHGVVNEDGTCSSDPSALGGSVCGGTFRGSGRQAAHGAAPANGAVKTGGAQAGAQAPAGAQAAHLMDGAGVGSAEPLNGSVSGSVRAAAATPLLLVLVTLVVALL